MKSTFDIDDSALDLWHQDEKPYRPGNWQYFPPFPHKFCKELVWVDKNLIQKTNG
jgi:hypothetical protein